MNRRRRLLLSLAGFAGAGKPWAQALPPPKMLAPPPQPIGELKPLGDDRFQVGQVVIDKRARSFTVPGRVHALGKPLEYLATTPRGQKQYEALFELDTTGSEFNLACILVGLERDPMHVAARRSGPGPLLGPRVAISVAWPDGSGKRQRLSAAQALLSVESAAKPEAVEWVYTGSPISDPSRPFAADITGSLIAFKRDPSSVVESALGIGAGAYGTVRGNPMLPPPGSPIELIVDAAAGGK